MNPTTQVDIFKEEEETFIESAELSIEISFQKEAGPYEPINIDCRGR
jgi:hypothetical protein